MENRKRGNPNLKKGVILNPNGKVKGTTNKTTEEMREIIKVVITKQLGRLEEDLNAMSPRNRWDIANKLLNYFMPTISMSQNQNHNYNEGKVEVLIKYKETTPQMVQEEPFKLIEDNQLIDIPKYEEIKHISKGDYNEEEMTW